MIDFHSHILHGVDDGARDVETSLALLNEEKKQGVDTVILTPHFYPDKDSISEFKERTDSALKSLKKQLNADLPEILKGAEVALTYELPKLENLKELCIEGTNTILIELPYLTYNEWVLNSLFEIRAKGLTPVIAHFERYISFDFFNTLYEKIIDMNYDVQINSTFIFNTKEKKFFKKLIKNGVIPILGSDTHNLNGRFINLSDARKYILKKYKSDVLNSIDNKPYNLINMKL